LARQPDAPTRPIVRSEQGVRCAAGGIGRCQ
jgi:hypothetical protein